MKPEPTLTVIPRLTANSRTRIEYYTGDLFESDPACNYIPKVLQEDPKALEAMRKNP